MLFFPRRPPHQPPPPAPTKTTTTTSPTKTPSFTHCIFLLSKQNPFTYKVTNPKNKIFPTMRPINPKESNLVNDIEVLLDYKVCVIFE